MTVPRTSWSKSGTTARTLPSNFSRMVLRWSSCIRIRFITNSGASAPSARRSRTMLTITPPTGIPNSWNQPMKRLITAIGSASGSVTKKNAVRVASVRSWRACPIRVRNPSRYSSSGSASFFFMKASISRSVRAAGGFDVRRDAILVDDYVGALRPLIGLPLHVVVLEDSVVLEHFLFHVAEEWEFDVDLLGECCVCRWGIHTDTEDCRIVFVDLTGSESSLDRLKLLRSTTGESEDVNGEKDIFLAVEVRELDGLPLIAEKGKVRS